MHTIGNGSQSQAQSSLQTIVSWIIVIAFVALAADWQSVGDYIAKRNKEIEASKVSINSPEGRELLREIRSAIKEIDAHALAETITPEIAAQQQIRVRDAGRKLSIDDTVYLQRAYNTAMESYAKSWQPPAGLDTTRISWMKDPDQRKTWIENEFMDAFIMARDGRAEGAINNPEFRAGLARLGLWILKWYYLFTIPSILIVMINLIFARKSVREEIIIGHRYWLRAALGGPIGIFCNSETGSRIRRYHELRNQYFAQYGWKHLDAEIEDALWLQTMKPLLRFDQALQEIKQSEQRLRRPLIVVVLSSIMCVRVVPMGHHDIKSPMTSVVAPDDGGHKLSMQGGDDNHLSDDGESIENICWAVPTGEIEYRQEVRPCQPVMLAAYRPRGPPMSNRCQGGNADEFPISLALPEETEK